MKIFLLSIVFFLSQILKADPIQSSIGHFYWGLGPNYSLMGNVRFGASKFEVGVLQGAGFGIVYIQRTSSPLFYQIGPVITSAGAGLLGGGGMEWNTSSVFRFRTDITVGVDSGFQTQGFVSLGGVFIL